MVLQDLHSEETVRTFILKAEQIQADIPLEGWMALPIMPSWRMDLGQLYPVTATVYLKFRNMFTSIKRDRHFGRPKTTSFDSVLIMDQLAPPHK